MKLLIVDDSNIMRRAISKYVGELNVEIVGTASNGREALDVFRRTMPDLVTLDITMPQMDGLACLEELFKIKKQTRVIVISALTDAATGIKVLKLGAKAFLPKPFTEVQLVHELKSVMARPV